MGSHESRLLAAARLLALSIDGHFAVEQANRRASGRWFNFNGTAGVWRRDALVDAGGWEHDTLTEDLDLSYRAQLRGWRFVYDGSVAAPAELPAQVEALKAQQRRWAKGSIQTARKLLPEVLSDLVAALGPGTRVLVGIPERDLLVAGGLTAGDDEFAVLFAEFIRDHAAGADQPRDCPSP